VGFSYLFAAFTLAFILIVLRSSQHQSSPPLSIIIRNKPSRSCSIAKTSPLSLLATSLANRVSFSVFGSG
jgi:hypothetical protein